jgi:hypothetical protein
MTQLHCPFFRSKPTLPGKLSECKASESGHQNGHQMSKKRYELVKANLLDYPMKSGIFELQTRGKSGNPGHWLHFELCVQQEVMNIDRAMLQ